MQGSGNWRNHSQQKFRDYGITDLLLAHPSAAGELQISQELKMFQNSQFSFPEKKGGGQEENSSTSLHSSRPPPQKSLEDSLITTVIPKKSKIVPLLGHHLQRPKDYTWNFSSSQGNWPWLQGNTISALKTFQQTWKLISCLWEKYNLT